MKKLKNLYECHKFFVKESKTYVAPFRFKDWCYYPIAYIKFMWYSIID